MQTSLPSGATINPKQIQLFIEYFKKKDRSSQCIAVCLLEEEMKSQNQKDLNTTIEKFAESGILKMLIDYLAISDISGFWFKTLQSIISIIRMIVRSKSKHILILIERIMYHVSNSPAPTYGILQGLVQLSWAHDFAIRAKIINEEILNYLLSHFKPDCIHNVHSGSVPQLPMIQIKSSLLFRLIHFEFSVNKYTGEFIKKRGKEIANLLDNLINVDDDHIVSQACKSFKRLSSKLPQLVSHKSFLKVCNLLTSNNVEIATDCLLCMSSMLSETNVVNFIQQNVLKRVANSLCCLMTHYIHTTMLIEKLLRYSQSEYVVHCIIQNNLIATIMKIIDNETVVQWALEIIWDVLDLGNEQHVYFMINQDVIRYLCDKQLYSKLNLKDEATDYIVLRVFTKLLKFGNKQKAFNSDKNVIAVLIKKYNGFQLIKEITSKAKETTDANFKQFLQLVNKTLMPYCDKLTNEDINDDSMTFVDFELITSYLIREFHSHIINNDPFKIIPKSVQNIITKFCFIKCTFSVSYLQFGLDVGDNILINKNKICNCCQNVAMNLQRCGGCKYVFYCNRICQRKNWKSHKSTCREITGYNIIISSN